MTLAGVIGCCIGAATGGLVGAVVGFVTGQYIGGFARGASDAVHRHDREMMAEWAADQERKRSVGS